MTRAHVGKCIDVDLVDYSPGSFIYGAECRSVEDAEALSRVVGVRSIGIDLREYFRQRPQLPDTALSPATQAMLITTLLRQPWQADWQPAEVVAELGYTPMTLSRAVKELTAAGIATLYKTIGQTHRPAAGAWFSRDGSLRYAGSVRDGSGLSWAVGRAFGARATGVMTNAARVCPVQASAVALRAERGQP